MVNGVQVNCVNWEKWKKYRGLWIHKTIGGGFGGTYFAKSLKKKFGRVSWNAVANCCRCQFLLDIISSSVYGIYTHNILHICSSICHSRYISLVFFLLDILKNLSFVDRIRSFITHWYISLVVIIKINLNIWIVFSESKATRDIICKILKWEFHFVSYKLISTIDGRTILCNLHRNQSYSHECIT